MIASVWEIFMLTVLQELQQWPLSHFLSGGLWSQVFLCHEVDKLILQILPQHKSRWTGIHSGPYEKLT